jgi:hypothetical protein
MATVPNYYYNSPWIADVGRNLASALAPPDPTVLQQREKGALELEALRTNAANTAVDRERSERARTKIGGLYRLREKPIIGPDGKPDQAATDREAYRLAAEAMEEGPKDIRAEVDDALFEASPSFRRKKLIQQAVSAAAANRLSTSLAGALDQIRTRGGVQQGLQDDAQAHDLLRLDKLYGHRMAEWQVRIAAAAKRSNSRPITITPALRDGIYKEIMRLERASGHPLTDDARFALGADIAGLTQETGDYVSAAQTMWKSRFPQASLSDAPTQPLPEKDSFWNDALTLINQDPFFTDQYLVPNASQPAAASPTTPPADAASTTPPAADEGRTLGGAATAPPRNYVEFGDRERAAEDESRARLRAEMDAPPAPSPTPAAAPQRRPPNVPKGASARGKPKEGDRTKSKSGKPMVYRNGKWVYER